MPHETDGRTVLGAVFVDDNGEKVQAVTAEQHALDNPGHEVRVTALPRNADGFSMLRMTCTSIKCDHWWNEEGYQ